ncbi:hypothetical protein R3P38DRAFT_2848370 [Favolaschia claudopus]|uniref:Uncharacterized protein n=1 Tax=Favolaschia claudopus TaxID=2862362 RepID=A0AAW0DVA7_9AGAR
MSEPLRKKPKIEVDSVPTLPQSNGSEEQNKFFKFVQAAVLDTIRTPAYAALARLGIFPPEHWRRARSAPDKHRLGSHEYKGDRRFSVNIADLSARLFPRASLRQLSRIQGPVQTNWTFQNIVYVQGLDHHSPEDYYKDPGNCLEIHYDLLASHSIEDAHAWIEELFTPLILSASKARDEYDEEKRQTKAAQRRALEAATRRSDENVVPPLPVTNTTHFFFVRGSFSL